MDYIKYTDLGREGWNHALLDIEGASFLTTAENIDFICDYSENLIVNDSFLLMQNGIAIAAVILCVENFKGEIGCSWAGRYCPAPIVSNNLEYKLQEKILYKLFEIINGIVDKHKISYLKFSLDCLTNPENKVKVYNYNYLLKYGFLDDSGMKQLIDLRVDVKKLHSDIRKGHKSSIKQGQCFSILFYDSSNITMDEIMIYRDIYIYDAGSITKNSEMTKHYYNFVKNGKAVLGLAIYNNMPVAVIIATLYKDTAYYSSYAEKTDLLNNNSVGHILQWKLMMYLKENGVNFYDIGEQEYGSTHYNCVDDKAKKISFYKRGFGGYTVPHFKGIKMVKFN